MTLMEFSMIPLDKGDSFSKYVSATLDIIDKSGLDYRLTPMGTVVEGEWDDLMTLLSSCFKALEEISDRISISAKFDHRKGKSGRLDTKIASVKEKAERKIRS